MQHVASAAMNIHTLEDQQPIFIRTYVLNNRRYSCMVANAIQPHAKSATITASVTAGL